MVKNLKRLLFREFKETHYFSALATARCKKVLFRNIKDEIIPEVFISNLSQPYQKKYLRVSGIITEDHQNSLFKEDREIWYPRRNTCRKIGKVLHEKNNGKNAHFTI